NSNPPVCSTSHSNVWPLYPVPKTGIDDNAALGNTSHKSGQTFQSRCRFRCMHWIPQSCNNAPRSDRTFFSMCNKVCQEREGIIQTAVVTEVRKVQSRVLLPSSTVLLNKPSVRFKLIQFSLVSLFIKPPCSCPPNFSAHRPGFGNVRTPPVRQGKQSFHASTPTSRNPLLHPSVHPAHSSGPHVPVQVHHSICRSGCTATAALRWQHIYHKPVYLPVLCSA